MDRATAIEIVSNVRTAYINDGYYETAEALQVALTDMREAMRKEGEENHA
jgi:hypothetical protein